MLAEKEAERDRRICESMRGSAYLSAFDPLNGEIVNLKRRVKASRRETYDSVLRSRPSVLAQGLPIGPPAEVMDVATKAEWFASLDDATRADVYRFGLVATRAAMVFEIGHVEDEWENGAIGFYESRSADFQADVDLAANLVDDGEPWRRADTL